MTTTPRRLTRKQIRPKLVVTHDEVIHGPHQPDDLRDAHRGNPVVIPFGQRLWRDFHKPREGGLTAAMGVTAFKAPSDHPRVLRQHLSVINQNLLSTCNVFDCNGTQYVYDKPMVYNKELPPLPAPEGFRTFAEWTEAVCGLCYGAQQMFASEIGITPQSVVSWRNDGSIPKPKTLKTISDRFRIPYDSLLLLANGGNAGFAPKDSQVLRTAEMMREWNNISDEDTQTYVIEQMRRINAFVAKREQPKRSKKVG